MPASKQLQPLREHDLFSSLSTAKLAKLAKHIESLNLYNEQFLFRQGDAADRFFIVVKGQIKLFRIGPDGEEKVIEIKGPGQSFGEAIMFMKRQAYPVSAQALQDSQLLTIPNHHYLDLLREHPETCFDLLGKLCMRLHQRLIEIESLSHQNTTTRVAGYLLTRLPADAAHNTTLQLQAPKQVIASQLGMKPETFSRALANLAKQRAIDVRGRKIVILDRSLLKTGGVHVNGKSA